MSVVFGYLPVFISKKYPIVTKNDPGFNKKARQNVIFSALLNFGGGALLANCFLHWLPEVREAIGKAKIDSPIPITELTLCLGFFMIRFVEELVHKFIQPKKKPPPEPEPKKSEFELYDSRRLEQQQSNGHVPYGTKTADPEVVDEDLTNEADETKSLLRTFFVVASMSFHSIIAGLTLGLEKDVAGIWINYAAIAMHKHVIDFLIGVELVTSKASRAAYLISIVVFASAPVVGTIIAIALSELGDSNFSANDDLALQLIQAIAAGTVMFVLFFEIFPKAVEMGGTGFQHVIAMMIGFAIFLPSLLLHSDHHDSDEGSGHAHGGSGTHSDALASVVNPHSWNEHGGHNHSEHAY